MPEGDSLHSLAAELAPLLTGKPLAALHLVRKTAETAGLEERLVVGVEARGKNLLVHFDGGLSLHVHLKMNGRVRIYPRDDSRSVNERRAVVVLDTATHRVIVYDAPVARLIRSRDIPRDFHFRNLGPDLLAAAFDLDEALGRLKRKQGTPLGEAVMDQSVVAGIGNVWKSELCFTLRLDPFAMVGAFDDTALSSLLSLARTQLRDNVYGPKRTIPDPFDGPYRRRTRLDRREGELPVSVYGREGKACYDCNTPILMRRQGEDLRSTYYCPSCQEARHRA
jgi:endonuclease-8